MRPRKDIDLSAVITRRHLDMLDPASFDEMFTEACRQYDTNKKHTRP